MMRLAKQGFPDVVCINAHSDCHRYKRRLHVGEK
jgi:hypothetical protein